MKIVQSFWSKPFEKGRESGLSHERVTGGFLDKRYFYYSCALSCLQLRKFYDEVELVTDKKGKILLIDLLTLPYTKYSEELNELDGYDESLWALGKIKAYQIQRQPFIHVDNDVFIWKKFPRAINKGRLISQNHEVNLMDEVIDEIKAINKKAPYLPAYIEQEGSNFSMYNAGIFGGNDIDFFKLYTGEVFKLVDENHLYIPMGHRGAFNFYYEQFLFTCLVKKKRKKVKCLLKGVLPNFSNIVIFNKVPIINNYIHIIGSFKRNEMIMSKLESRIRMDYPQYYYKINNLIDNNII